MSNEKSKAELLKEKLFYEAPHVAQSVGDDEVSQAKAFCEDYKIFLDNAKTEREAVNEVVAMARAQGFVPYDNSVCYKAGDKVYFNNRNKSIILAVIGKKGTSEGVRISAAHIDSPRLDLKPNPLYETDMLAYFKTHYYGGIKKYQWTAIPLAIHGVVIKKSGEEVEIKLGENQGEPCFVVTDLLPHLGAAQMKKPMSEGIKGEDLNITIGSLPFPEYDGSDAVKLNILNILNEKYGIDESDFLSAELEIVPAFKASDIGFDRSLIGSYGHDDRVCAYPAAKAIFDIEVPEKTAITVLTDKEEIGSEGNTGLNSNYLLYFVHNLAKNEGQDGFNVLSRSECLSADVTSAFDPTFAEVFEKRNVAYVNKGVAIMKYTGARGKSGTSDASAEFMARIRNILDSKKICWQVGELGKVDEGGGGTVAKYVAALDVDVIDIGVPVLSMHAPYEVVSKLDVYMAYRAFYEFFVD